jgi:hypothetical protein
MVISKKQHAANQKNAQHSTGPKTLDGKNAVRFNALTWSLRAQRLMTPRDNPADYQKLWDALEADWRPQNDTERHYLELMVIAKWLLTRTADSERRVYEADMSLEKELSLLDRISARVARLERSFNTAMHELERLQLKREARRQRQPSEPASETASQPAESTVPPSDYVRSEAAPDTR